MAKRRSYVGEQNTSAKLTDKDVLFIHNAHAWGFSNKEMADKFKVTPGAICHILKGRTWKHGKVDL